LQEGSRQGFQNLDTEEVKLNFLKFYYGSVCLYIVIHKRFMTLDMKAYVNDVNSFRNSTNTSYKQSEYWTAFA